MLFIHFVNKQMRVARLRRVWFVTYHKQNSQRRAMELFKLACSVYITYD